MQQRVATVIGGSGFLGRYVVRELARGGWRVRVICRDPDAAGALRTSGSVGEIVIEHGDLTRPETVTDKLAGSTDVINLAGILFERGRQTFAALHAQGAEKLAQAAKAQGVGRFIHVSALGVDKAKGAHYARTKMLGERAVLAAFPAATILRPSVVFGPEDNFFNQFARMAMFSPFLPLIGGGKTKFQPVYAADVARAVAVCLDKPETRGKTYELGGPDVMSFRDVLEFVMKTTGRRRLLLPLPFPLASLIGTLAEFLPAPPLTRDQVRLLHTDNVVAKDALSFENLGITPSPASLVAPEYLAAFAKPGRKAA